MSHTEATQTLHTAIGDLGTVLGRLRQAKTVTRSEMERQALLSAEVKADEALDAAVNAADYLEAARRERERSQ